MPEKKPDAQAAVLAAIDDSWRGLHKALTPLTSKDMEARGVCGEWSVKDVIGHITTWEAAVLRELNGSSLTGINIDEFNEQEVQVKSKMSAREIMAELESTHRALRDALGAAPDSHFKHGTPMRRKIDEDTVLHYDEHAQHIRQWAREHKRAAAE